MGPADHTELLDSYISGSQNDDNDIGLMSPCRQCHLFDLILRERFTVLVLLVMLLITQRDRHGGGDPPLGEVVVFVDGREPCGDRWFTFGRRREGGDEIADDRVLGSAEFAVPNNVDQYIAVKKRTIVVIQYCRLLPQPSEFSRPEGHVQERENQNKS